MPICKENAGLVPEPETNDIIVKDCNSNWFNNKKFQQKPSKGLNSKTKRINNVRMSETSNLLLTCIQFEIDNTISLLLEKINIVTEYSKANNYNIGSQNKRWLKTLEKLEKLNQSKKLKTTISTVADTTDNWQCLSGENTIVTLPVTSTYKRKYLQGSIRNLIEKGTCSTVSSEDITLSQEDFPGEIFKQGVQINPGYCDVKEIEGNILTTGIFHSNLSTKTKQVFELRNDKIQTEDQKYFVCINTKVNGIANGFESGNNKDLCKDKTQSSLDSADLLDLDTTLSNGDKPVCITCKNNSFCVLDCDQTEYIQCRENTRHSYNNRITNSPLMEMNNEIITKVDHQVEDVGTKQRKEIRDDSVSRHRKITKELKKLKLKTNDDLVEVKELFKHELDSTEEELSNKQLELDKTVDKIVLIEEKQLEDQIRSDKLDAKEKVLTDQLWNITDELLTSKLDMENRDEKLKRKHEINEIEAIISKEIITDVAATNTVSERDFSQSPKVTIDEVMRTVIDRSKATEELESSNVAQKDVNNDLELNKLSTVKSKLKRTKWVLSSRGLEDQANKSPEMIKNAKKEYTSTCDYLKENYEEFPFLLEEKMEEEIGEYSAKDFQTEVIKREMEAELNRLEKRKLHIIERESHLLDDLENKNENKQEVEARYKNSVIDLLNKKDLLLKETIKLCKDEFTVFYEKFKEALKNIAQKGSKDENKNDDDDEDDEFSGDPLFALLDETNKNINKNDSFIKDVNIYIEDSILPNNKLNPLYKLMVDHRNIEMEILRKTDPLRPRSVLLQKEKEELDKLKNKQIILEDNIADQTEALQQISTNLSKERDRLIGEVRQNGAINLVSTDEMKSNKNHLQKETLLGYIKQLEEQEKGVITYQNSKHKSLIHLVKEYNVIVNELRVLFNRKSGSVPEVFPFSEVDDLRHKEADWMSDIEARVTAIAKFRFHPVDIRQLTKDYITELGQIKNNIDDSWNHLLPKKVKWWSDVRRTGGPTHKVVKELQKEVNALYQKVDAFELAFSEESKIRLMKSLQTEIDAKMTRIKTKITKVQKQLDVQTSLKMNLNTIQKSNQVDNDGRRKSIAQLVSLDFLLGSKGNIEEKLHEIQMDIDKEFDPVKVYFVPESLNHFSIDSAYDVSAALQELLDESKKREIHVFPDGKFWDRGYSKTHLVNCFIALIEVINELENKKKTKNTAEDISLIEPLQNTEEIKEKIKMLTDKLIEYQQRINQELKSIETENENEHPDEVDAPKKLEPITFQQLNKERHKILQDIGHAQSEKDKLGEDEERKLTKEQLAAELKRKAELENEVSFLSTKRDALKDEIDQLQQTEIQPTVKKMEEDRVQALLGDRLFTEIFQPEEERDEADGETKPINKENDFKVKLKRGELTVQAILEENEAELWGVMKAKIDLEKEKEQHEEAIKLLNNQLDMEREKKLDLEKNRDESEIKAISLAKQLQEKEALINEMSRNHNEQLNDAIASIRETFEEEKEALETDLENRKQIRRQEEEKLKRKLVEIEGTQDITEKEKQELKLRMDGVASENDTLSQDNERLKDELSVSRAERQHLVEKLQAQEAINKEMADVLQQMEAEGSDLQMRLKEHEAEIMGLNNKVAKHSEVEQRKQLAEDRANLMDFECEKLKQLLEEKEEEHEKELAIVRKGRMKFEHDALIEKLENEFKLKVKEINQQAQREKDRLTRMNQEERLKWDEEIGRLRKEFQLDAENKLKEQKSDLEKAFNTSLYEYLRSSNEEIEDLQSKNIALNQEKMKMALNFSEEKHQLMKESEDERLCLEAMIQDLLKSVIINKGERQKLKKTHRDELIKLEEKCDIDKYKLDSERRSELIAMREKLHRTYSHGKLQYEKDVLQETFNKIIEQQNETNDSIE